MRRITRDLRKALSRKRRRCDERHRRRRRDGDGRCGCRDMDRCGERTDVGLPSVVMSGFVLRGLARRRGQDRSVHRTDDERRGSVGAGVRHPAGGQKRAHQHRDKREMQSGESYRARHGRLIPSFPAIGITSNSRCGSGEYMQCTNSKALMISPDLGLS